MRLIDSSRYLPGSLQDYFYTFLEERLVHRCFIKVLNILRDQIPITTHILRKNWDETSCHKLGDCPSKMQIPHWC